VSRVYLIFRNELFRDAIGAVLGSHPEIERVGAGDKSDQVAADIAALAPDVVLMEETDDGPAVRDMHTILSKTKPCRLITLRLDKDGMHVWHQTWRQIVRTQDLVAAIIGAGETQP
jgi:chemotaxis response regulator CheB